MVKIQVGRELRLWELIVFFSLLWLSPVGLFLALWISGLLSALTPENIAGLILVIAPTAASSSIVFILWRLAKHARP